MIGNVITTDTAPKAIGPYSQARERGGLVFLSGQLGVDAKTGEMGGDVAEQARLSLENIGAILSAAGLSYGSVLKTTVFLTDMSAFPIVNEIYAGFFKDGFPARSCVAVAALPKGGLVEIEAVAAR